MQGVLRHAAAVPSSAVPQIEEAVELASP